MPNNWVLNYSNHKPKRKGTLKPDFDTYKGTRSNAKSGVNSKSNGSKSTDAIPPTLCKGGCDSPIHDEEALKCESCPDKFCNSCLDMEIEYFEFIKDRPDCFWRCPNCHEDINNAREWEDNLMNKIDGKLEKLQENLTDNNTVAAIQKQMKQFEEKIEKKIADQSSKLENSTKILNDVPEQITQKVTKSWADNKNDAQPENFRDIVQEALALKESEDRKKDEREYNLIIYRAEESKSDDSEERKKHDKEFFTEVAKITKTEGIEVASINRIGEKKDDIKRPLRIVLKNKAAKIKVLENAKLLAKAENKYQSISISADYSKEERAKIKAKVEEAKKLSEDDLNHVWKVRGPPWDLRLKKLPKRD